MLPERKNMAIFIGAVAKQVLYGYRDMQKLLEENVNRKSVAALVHRYNQDLEFIREWFNKGDQSYLEPIAHLQPLSVKTNGWWETWLLSRRIRADGRLLLATTHDFLEEHLQPEDKAETGFK